MAQMAADRGKDFLRTMIQTRRGMDGVWRQSVGWLHELKEFHNVVCAPGPCRSACWIRWWMTGWWRLRRHGNRAHRDLPSVERRSDNERSCFSHLRNP